jgi:hypothetical protein
MTWSRGIKKISTSKTTLVLTRLTCMREVTVQNFDREKSFPDRGFSVVSLTTAR